MAEGHVSQEVPHIHSDSCTHDHYRPRVFTPEFPLRADLLTLNARSIRKQLGMLATMMATHRDFQEIVKYRTYYPQFLKRDTWFLGIGGLVFPLHILYRHPSLGLVDYHWPGKPPDGTVVIPLIKEPELVK